MAVTNARSAARRACSGQLHGGDSDGPAGGGVCQRVRASGRRRAFVGHGLPKHPGRDHRSLVDSCQAQVWVAAGYYRPVGGPNPSLVLRSGVELYGGFNGTETDISQRDYYANWSRLISDFTHTMVVGDGSQAPCDASAVLDGFYVMSVDNPWR